MFILGRFALGHLSVSHSRHPFCPRRAGDEIGYHAAVNVARDSQVEKHRELIGEGRIQLGMGEHGRADDDLAPRVELAVAVFLDGLCG